MLEVARQLAQHWNLLQRRHGSVKLLGAVQVQVYGQLAATRSLRGLQLVGGLQLRRLTLLVLDAVAQASFLGGGLSLLELCLDLLLLLELHLMLLAFVL